MPYYFADTLTSFTSLFMYSRFCGDVTIMSVRAGPRVHSFSSFSEITETSSQFDLCHVYTPSFTL